MTYLDLVRLPATRLICTRPQLVRALPLPDVDRGAIEALFLLVRRPLLYGSEKIAFAEHDAVLAQQSVHHRQVKEEIR